MKSIIQLSIALIGLLADPVAAQAPQPTASVEKDDPQLDREAQFCLSLYTDSLIRNVPRDEISRRFGAFYADPKQRNELASHCIIFGYGVDEAKSMLGGAPYSEPRGQRSKDTRERRTSTSGLRCHQMIQYELLYQRPTSDDDFMTSLGLSQQDKSQLVRDCKMYVVGMKAGDGLLAMGVLK